MTAILLSIILALVVAVLVWGPVFQPHTAAEGLSDSQQEEQDLKAERERVFLLLEEIEGDFRGGKLSASEHASLRAPLVARAREILERLEG